MQNFSLDRWLRPLGACFLVALGLLLMVLSFLGRESRNFENDARKPVIARLLDASSFVENWFYDIRNKHFFEHKSLSPNLVILNISDQSLAKIGRWPWTRTKHALVVDHLRAYGAKVVMFDVLFPEPESPAADKALAEAISRFSADNKRVVYLGYGLTREASEALTPLPDEIQISGLTGRPGKLPLTGSSYPDRYNFAAPALTLFEAKYGYINALADSDGVYRHQQIINEVEGTFFPSLGLGGFTDFYSDSQERRVLVEAAAESGDYRLRIQDGAKERHVLLNPRGELKIRFFGGPQNFESVAIEDVLLDPAPAQNEAMKKIFAGKAVLIGSSAFGAHDLRPTPVSTQTPGMFMHANLFHALDQNFLFRTEDESLLISLGLYLAVVAAVVGLFLLRSPVAETAGIIFLAGGLYAVDYFYFSPEGYYLRLFFCLFGVLSLHAWFTVLNVFEDAREKKKIRDTFTRYVAPEIVKEMLNHPDKLKVGGEKREITMLFSDVRDFTTMSEKLTPNELATLLNIYMGKMTDILFETGGTLDKYIGDALVGFWGAPLDLPNHAYQAVKGAKLMLEALPGINQEFERKKFPQINIGIGLNTGEVSVGNMGSDRIFQYTALGDHMNLASRLESLTKYYGVNLMISEFTHQKLAEHRREFRLRPLDLVQVKGKSKAVKIYEVIPDWSPWAKQEDLLAKYEEAYERKYLAGNFSEAVAIFGEILERIPADKNTKKLKESAEQLMAAPPPAGWDGVTIFQTK